MLTGVFRYYPRDIRAMDSDDDIEIKDEDLNKIASKHGVALSKKEVRGKNLTEKGGYPYEDGKIGFDEVTQTIITLKADTEASFRSALADTVNMYRSPVPFFGTEGSDERATRLAREVFDEWDGRS